jgi:hypothetical protein
MAQWCYNLKNTLKMKTMKFIKFLFIAGCATLAAACSDEFPAREDSPAGNENSMQVNFPAATNKVYRELEIAENTVAIYVSRVKADEAAEIPLTVLRNDENIFDIPATISFAQGETNITVDIPFSGEKIATEYSFEIKIEGDAYVNPYKKIAGNGVPQLAITIIKLQWEPFASGTFISSFDETSWPVTLHKALGTNKYRFFNLYISGYNFNFEWKDGEKNIVINPTDISVKSGTAVYYGQHTGYIMSPDYGNAKVYAFTDTDPEVTYYEAEKDEQGEVIKERFVINSYFGFIYDGQVLGFGWLDEIFEFTTRKE